MAHFSSKTKDFSKKYVVRRMTRDGYKPQNTSERALKIIFVFSPQNNVKSLSLSAKPFFQGVSRRIRRKKESDIWFFPQKPAHRTLKCKNMRRFFCFTRKILPHPLRPKHCGNCESRRPLLRLRTRHSGKMRSLFCVRRVTRRLQPQRSGKTRPPPETACGAYGGQGRAFEPSFPHPGETCAACQAAHTPRRTAAT